MIPSKVASGLSGGGLARGRPRGAGAGGIAVRRLGGRHGRLSPGPGPACQPLASSENGSFCCPGRADHSSRILRLVPVRRFGPGSSAACRTLLSETAPCRWGGRQQAGAEPVRGQKSLLTLFPATTARELQPTDWSSVRPQTWPFQHVPAEAGPRAASSGSSSSRTKPRWTLPLRVSRRWHYGLKS